MRKSNTTVAVRWILGLTLMLLIFILPLTAQDDEPIDPVTTLQPVFWWSGEDHSAIEGAEAILTRMEHGISMSFDTVGLEPGEVYTAWWVIFNSPENCSNGECFLDDIFMMNDAGDFILNNQGLEQLNRLGIETARISSLRATGTVADADGRAVFMAHLPIGDTTDYMDFGDGLLDPMNAEIHVVLRTHGPVIPELLWEQLFTSWGGCPDPENRAPCKNAQFAVFLPSSN